MDFDKEIIQPHTNLDYTKESIKLVKNSKGYTWEVKIIASSIEGVLNQNDLDHLINIDLKLNTLYGKTEI